MTDEATICHQTVGRMRIRIPSRRGDNTYFSELRSEFEGICETVEANPHTGSLLLESDRVDAGEIAAFALERGFFELADKNGDAEPLYKKFSAPIGEINAGIRKISGGDFDLPGVFFMLLIVFGVIELIRGNFRTPPWYTAFWYAFGVFSKSLMDRN